MTALTPAEHDRINAQSYPGTREMCLVCDEPTGNAGKGDGSLYCPDCEKGPYCWVCYEVHCPRLASDGWRYHALDAEEAWLVTDGLGPLSKYQPASTEA